MADFPGVIDLTDLDSEYGFVIQGDAAGDLAGASVSDAGDVNGDGIGDLIVGAPRGDDNGEVAGEAYVIFGKDTGWGAIDLGALAPTDGFIITGGVAFDNAGFAVSSAGDVNGDGFDDVIVGAPGNNNSGYFSGEAYVVYGKAGGSATLDLGALAAADGFSIGGGTNGDFTGFAVSSAGDVNGDGIDDIIVGAPTNAYSYESGKAYVIFGKLGERSAVDLANLAAEDGFALQGQSVRAQTGLSVSGGGDINGDGLDDVVIGAPAARYVYEAPGRAYVVFGKAGASGTVDLAALGPADGFVMEGRLYDETGFSVSIAGDINGDGFDDIVIGASRAGGNDYGRYGAGAAYVVFGKAEGFGPIDLPTLAAADGFVIEGVASYDLTGDAVSSAGDVNGDGFDDIIVAAPEDDAGGSNTGKMYLIFGKADGFGPIDLANLGAPDGFAIQGDSAYDRAGTSVSGAGDIDGDGFDDLIVGAPYGDDGGADAGEAYVIYGRAPTMAVERIGAAADQVIRGGDFDDTLSGLGGDDTLNGGKGDDTLVGGAGNDVLRGTAGDDTMVGGEGDDMYFVETAGDVVMETTGEGADMVIARTDFSAGSNEVELIRSKSATGLALTGGDNATKIRGGAGADTLTGGAAGDVITGAGGADRIVASGGNDFAKGGGGADSFVLGSVVSGADRVRIADFTSGTDTIELDADDFGGGLTRGALDPDAFVANLTGSAEDAEDRLIYNSFSGVLSFDADGTGEQEAIDIARLMRSPTIDASDFLITGSAPEAPLAAMSEGAADRWWASPHELAPGLSQIA